MKLSTIAVAVALALGSMSVAAQGKKAPTKAPAKAAKPVQKPGPAKVKIDYNGATFGTPLKKFKSLVPELPCQEKWPHAVGQFFGIRKWSSAG